MVLYLDHIYAWSHSSETSSYNVTFADLQFIIYTWLTPRFNIQNMNKQFRLYQQGMTPLIKTVPGRGSWERLRGWPEYEVREHASQPIHNKVQETLLLRG